MALHHGVDIRGFIVLIGDISKSLQFRLALGAQTVQLRGAGCRRGAKRTRLVQVPGVIVDHHLRIPIYFAVHIFRVRLSGDRNLMLVDGHEQGQRLVLTQSRALGPGIHRRCSIDANVGHRAGTWRRCLAIQPVRAILRRRVGCPGDIVRAALRRGVRRIAGIASHRRQCNRKNQCELP